MTTFFYQQAPAQQQFSPGFYQSPYTQQHIVYQTPLTSTPQHYPYSSALPSTIPSPQLKYTTSSNNLSPYQYVVYPSNAKYVVDPSYNYLQNNEQEIQYLNVEQPQQSLNEYHQIQQQPQQYTVHQQHIPPSHPSLKQISMSVQTPYTTPTPIAFHSQYASTHLHTQPPSSITSINPTPIPASMTNYHMDDPNIVIDTDDHISVHMDDENTLRKGDVLLFDGKMGIIKYMGPLFSNINHEPIDNRLYIGVECTENIDHGHNGILKDMKYFDISSNLHQSGILIERNVELQKKIQPCKLLNTVKKQLQITAQLQQNIENLKKQNTNLRTMVDALLMRQQKYEQTTDTNTYQDIIQLLMNTNEDTKHMKRNSIEIKDSNNSNRSISLQSISSQQMSSSATVIVANDEEKIEDNIIQHNNNMLNARSIHGKKASQRLDAAVMKLQPKTIHEVFEHLNMDINHHVNRALFQSSEKTASPITTSDDKHSLFTFPKVMDVLPQLDNKHIQHMSNGYTGQPPQQQTLDWYQSQHMQHMQPSYTNTMNTPNYEMNTPQFDHHQYQPQYSSYSNIDPILLSQQQYNNDYNGYVPSPNELQYINAYQAQAHAHAQHQQVMLQRMIHQQTKNIGQNTDTSVIRTHTNAVLNDDLSGYEAAPPDVSVNDRSVKQKVSKLKNRSKNRKREHKPMTKTQKGKVIREHDSRLRPKHHWHIQSISSNRDSPTSKKLFKQNNKHKNIIEYNEGNDDSMCDDSQTTTPSSITSSKHKYQMSSRRSTTYHSSSEDNEGHRNANKDRKLTEHERDERRKRGKRRYRSVKKRVTGKYNYDRVSPVTRSIEEDYEYVDSGRGTFTRKDTPSTFPVPPPKQPLHNNDNHPPSPTTDIIDPPDVIRNIPDDIITHELIANHKSRRATKRNESNVRQIIVNEDTIDIAKSGSTKRMVIIGVSSGKSPNEDSLMNSLDHSSSDSEDEPLANTAQQPGTDMIDYFVEEVSTTKSTDTPLNIEDSPFNQFADREKRISYGQHMSEMSFGTDGLVIPSPVDIHSPENRILFYNPRYKYPNIIELMVDDDIDDVWDIFGNVQPPPIHIKPLSVVDGSGKKIVEAFFESQQIAKMVFELLNEQIKALKKSLKSPSKVKNDPLSSCQLRSILSDDMINDNDNDNCIQMKQPQFNTNISNETETYVSEEPYGIIGDPRIRHVDGDVDNESLAWTEGSSPAEEVDWALGLGDVSGSSGGGWLDSDPEEENNEIVDISQLQSSSILQK